MRLHSGLIVAFVLISALPAHAKVTFDSLPNHRFSGGVEARFQSASNIGGQPASTGVDADDFDDEDDADDFDADDFGEDDLDSLLDDSDLDNEDLEEQDGAADEDLDGLDDALDASAGPAGNKDSEVQRSARLKLGHEYRFSKRAAWKSAFLAEGNQNKDRDDLERARWAVNTGPVFKVTPAFSLQPSVTYTEASQDGDRKIDQWIASFGAGWKVSKALKLSARYNYQDRSGVPVGSPDAEVDSLKLGAKYKCTPNDVVNFAVMPSIEDSTRATQDKDRYGLQASYAHRFPARIVLAAKMRYTNTDYATIARNDDQYQYALGVRKGFDHGIYAGAAADYASRESSVAGKNFNNASFIASLGWKF